MQLLELNSLCEAAFFMSVAGVWSSQGRHLEKEDGCKVEVIKDKVEPTAWADTKIDWNPCIFIIYGCCNKLLQI